MPGVSPVPAAETGWLQAGEGKSFSCSLCRKYLKNVKHIVTDKDTEKQIEKQVSKTVCPTMGDMEETCKLLVPIMVPKIMEATGNAILEKGCAPFCDSGVPAEDAAELVQAAARLHAAEALAQLPQALRRAGKGPNDLSCDLCKGLLSDLASLLQFKDFTDAILYMWWEACSKIKDKGGYWLCYAAGEDILPLVEKQISDFVGDGRSICAAYEYCAAPRPFA